jgi:hypothetical protein
VLWWPSWLRSGLRCERCTARAPARTAAGCYRGINCGVRGAARAALLLHPALPGRIRGAVGYWRARPVDSSAPGDESHGGAVPLLRGRA